DLVPDPDSLVACDKTRPVEMGNEAHCRRHGSYLLTDACVPRCAGAARCRATSPQHGLERRVLGRAPQRVERLGTDGQGVPAAGCRSGMLVGVVPPLSKPTVVR